MLAAGQDQVRTVAGFAGEPGTLDGVAATARFNDPAGIAIGPDGTVFVADSRNHVIRAATLAGVVTTLAGEAGEIGSSDGVGSTARFNHPTGIAVRPNGSIVVSDTGNHTLRQITTNGSVTTLSGFAESADHVDGPAADARFRSPLGLAHAPNGDLYIADCGNHVIRRLDGTGRVTTFAGRAEIWGMQDGTGTNATFNSPLGLAFDSQGNLFVSDANNFVIRKISSSAQVRLFAGDPGRDGIRDGADARFGKPAELVIDAHDNLYVADSLNHVVRRVRPDGFVSTVSGVIRASGVTDGLNGAARFFNPYGLAMTATGRLLVSDSYNQTLREITAPFTLAYLTGENQIVLTWNTVLGERYRVERASTLSPDQWLPLGEIQSATDLSTSFTNSLPVGDAAFLRVVRLP